MEFDLDWRAPVEAMRGELKKVLAETPLWDKHVGILQITDATAGLSACASWSAPADSACLFDLRCLIREELVLFLQQDHPTALPHVRLESLPSALAGSTSGNASDASGVQRPGKATLRPSAPAPDPHDSQLFTGSIEAIQRSKAFSGPGEDVFEDRDNAIASQNWPGPGGCAGQHDSTAGPDRSPQPPPTDQ